MINEVDCFDQIALRSWWTTANSIVEVHLLLEIAIDVLRYQLVSGFQVSLETRYYYLILLDLFLHPVVFNLRIQLFLVHVSRIERLPRHML